MADAFLRSIDLPPARDGEPRNGYPWTLPAILPLTAGIARTDFFLRAESLFNAATYLEKLNEDLDGVGAAIAGNPLAAYGGRSLHEQSHGSRSWR